VKNILEGAKRRLAVPTKKKEPITPELLLKMYDNLYSDNNVLNQRNSVPPNTLNIMPHE
jgi:hypothetical protein